MQHSMGRAADLLRQAADSGYPPAQCSLGLIFLEDTGAFAGVACDPSRAVEWFRKAAKQGLAEAQCQLGHMYAAGSGVERDAELAMEWCGAYLREGGKKERDRERKAIALGKWRRRTARKC